MANESGEEVAVTAVTFAASPFPLTSFVKVPGGEKEAPAAAPALMMLGVVLRREVGAETREGVGV